MERIKTVLESYDNLIVRSVFIGSRSITCLASRLNVNSHLDGRDDIVVGCSVSSYDSLLGSILANSLNVNTESIEAVLQCLENLVVLLGFNNSHSLFCLAIAKSFQVCSNTTESRLKGFHDLIICGRGGIKCCNSLVIAAIANRLNVGTDRVEASLEGIEDLIVGSQVSGLVGDSVHTGTEIVETIVEGIEDLTCLGTRSKNFLPQVVEAGVQSLEDLGVVRLSHLVLKVLERLQQIVHELLLASSAGSTVDITLHSLSETFETIFSSTKDLLGLPAGGSNILFRLFGHCLELLAQVFHDLTKAIADIIIVARRSWYKSAAGVNIKILETLSNGIDHILMCKVSSTWSHRELELFETITNSIDDLIS
ncbi:hypothetical protein HG531_002114 [Fusarium graminearum]|nr:hypothetical protein HG531_002114 [Fusarium graminearum]